MRRFFIFFLILLSFLIISNTAFAGPEDVRLIPLSRWDYKNVDGYGFYDKCGDSSWFAVVLHNDTETEYTVSLPGEARISGWNGTVHPLKNNRYKVMNFGSNNILREDREEIPFTGDLKLPAKSTYAVFTDVTDISAYNLYWDTNVFFTITVKSGNRTAAINISGILAQRGNACPADQVCSAKVISGSYASNGTGEVVVQIKNNMPDAARITAFSNVDITWTDSAGRKQTRSVDPAVAWNTQPEWMGSGTEKTISGTLSLPVEIAAASSELSLKFHFHHPSSLWFGDFDASKKMAMISGLQGAMTGSFEADGSGGTFSAVLNNHQDSEVSVTLPDTGTLTGSDGKSTNVSLKWDHSGPAAIPAQGRTELSGRFTFSDTSQIHNNSSLILSAELKSAGQSGTAAGTVTRNPDPDPKLTSVGFCRDYKSGEKDLTFVYALRNDSHIDLSVQLAGTLAVDEQPRNLTITYTDCESGGSSCKSRLNGTNFTIEAGETAAFYGKTALEIIPENPDISVYTSLLYTADGTDKALYVGRTASACTGPSDQPVPTASAVPAEPTAEPTEAPTAVPTPIPTAIPQPVPEAGEPVLDASVAGGSYARCGSDPSLRFTLTVRNSGTATGKLNTDAVRFSIEDSPIPVKFTSCAVMSAGGSDSESCQAGLASGSFTINPEVSLRLEAIYTPDEIIEADRVRILAESEELTDGGIEFEIISDSASCRPIVETVPGTDGRDILAEFSPNGNQVTLSIRLVNSGTKETKVTPGTIYLHNSALSAYQGTAVISPLEKNKPAGKDVIPFTKGEAIVLPARSDADISVSLNFDPHTVKVQNAAVSWNFSIDNDSRNFTGTISFPQAAEQPAEPPESDENDATDFFSAGEPAIPEILPATGFSAGASRGPVSVQPAHLTYQPTNGLHIEIPVIYASMEVVSVPVDEKGEWAVEWLTDQAGILESSPLPGEGTSVVAAHNHLDEDNSGPFVSIFSLEENDRIVVTDYDNNLLLYKVYANELVTPDDSASVYRTAIPGSLVLMTCEIEVPEGGYAYRRLIYAEPLQ